MLSFLIPVYNFDIVKLANDLSKQINETGIKAEIIIVDDASNTKYKQKNSEVETIDFVRYEELSENYGRSKIRNYLAQKAIYENLIFMDCDSQVNENYLKKYLAHSDKDVVYGGRLYPEKVDKKYSLHHYYGITRESLPVTIRQKNPVLSFRTNNFMIKKSLFEKVKFDEKIKSYGHEDTLFAIDLHQKGYQIHHIDNPVIHLGLIENKEFIKKTLTSVENLLLIYKRRPDLQFIFKRIKLISYFSKLKKLYLCGTFSFLFKITNKIIINLLTRKKTKIFLLDFLKLTYICKKEKEYKQLNEQS